MPLSVSVLQSRYSKCFTNTKPSFTCSLTQVWKNKNKNHQGHLKFLKCSRTANLEIWKTHTHKQNSCLGYSFMGFIWQQLTKTLIWRVTQTKRIEVNFTVKQQVPVFKRVDVIWPNNNLPGPLFLQFHLTAYDFRFSFYRQGTNVCLLSTESRQ